MFVTLHNIVIYHCVTCGRIVHAERSEKPPVCCGQPMVKASEATVHDDAGKEWQEPRGESSPGPEED